MPRRTEMLGYGNFVRRPTVPSDEAYERYLEKTDHLLNVWRQSLAKSKSVPSDLSLVSLTEENEQKLIAFVSPDREKYTVRNVERDLNFMTASTFFSEYYPITKPFSIVHCDLDMPLHTVLSFSTEAELRAINAAIGKDTPLRWWQDGLANRPCYLFGNAVWELRKSEAVASTEGVALLFMNQSERGENRLKQMRGQRQNPNANATGAGLQEKSQVSAWKRGGVPQNTAEKDISS